MGLAREIVRDVLSLEDSRESVPTEPRDGREATGGSQPCSPPGGVAHVALSLLCLLPFGCYVACVYMGCWGADLF